MIHDNKNSKNQHQIFATLSEVQENWQDYFPLEIFCLVISPGSLHLWVFIFSPLHWLSGYILGLITSKVCNHFSYYTTLIDSTHYKWLVLKLNQGVQIQIQVFFD
jgi:hypothetical protein